MIKKQKKFKIQLGERELTVETKGLAEQASGSCFVRYGDTLVLATVVMSENKREGIDYFPLTVNYEERYYAAGKILGSRYIRRESRPSDEAILTSRLIDRAIRPRFPKHIKNDVQVIITCLSWDRENDPDVIGLLAASIALSASDIPWSGPLATLRIGRKDGKFILNPTYSERENGDLDLTISALEKDNKLLVNMLEAEAKEVDEETVLKAIAWAKPHLKKLVKFQKEIADKVGKEKRVIEKIPLDPEIKKEIQKLLNDTLKQEGQFSELNAIREEALILVEEDYPKSSKELIKDFLEKETRLLLHKHIILKGKRPDDRKLDQIREIGSQAGLLPRTHGSGLFIRGQTKTLSILTLGAPGDVKLLAGMEIVGEKRFMHHYNFPPYSVGEVKPIAR
jgi:polyribonucleotide nucleotidyltransferase